MTLSTGITTFQPVFNQQQQLIALCPDFATMDQDAAIAALQHWKQLELFDQLPTLNWMVSVRDLNTLSTDLHQRLPASRIILCVPERVCQGQEMQARLKHFSSSGFRIYTDDFQSVSELAWSDTRDIVIDSHAGVPFFAKLWTLRLSHGQHWAKNVATAAVLEQALATGFKMFSGDYAFHPAKNNSAADSSAKTRLLKLLGLVARDADSKELEDLFKQDANLSYLLFRLVSSAAFAQTVKVSNFGQAINLLGRRQLQRWLQLLLYAKQSDQGGALNPLMARAAFRAAMMEALAQRMGFNRDMADGAFMVGMFSLLDTLFASPLAEVLQPLSLQEDYLAALLQRSGPLGRCLQLTEIADRRFEPALRGMLTELALSEDDYLLSVAHAFAWVNQVCKDM
jgi:EAL and modified HD-GYP domain-containing signal transduction protein